MRGKRMNEKKIQKRAREKEKKVLCFNGRAKKREGRKKKSKSYGRNDENAIRT
jgi:hypothetical protein